MLSRDGVGAGGASWQHLARDRAVPPVDLGRELPRTAEGVEIRELGDRGGEGLALGHFDIRAR